MLTFPALGTRGQGHFIFPWQIWGRESWHKHLPRTFWVLIKVVRVSSPELYAQSTKGNRENFHTQKSSVAARKWLRERMKVRNGEGEASLVTFRSSCRSPAGLGSRDLMESLTTCDEKGLSTSTVLLFSWGVLHVITPELWCVRSSFMTAYKSYWTTFYIYKKKTAPKASGGPFPNTGDSRCLVCWVTMYPSK